MLELSGFFYREASLHLPLLQINTDPMVHRSGYLEVVVPPRILGGAGREADLVVREGENLTLSCDAAGHPRPQIIWRRDDGEQIMVDGRKGGLVGLLTFKNTHCWFFGFLKVLLDFLCRPS